MYSNEESADQMSFSSSSCCSHDKHCHLKEDMPKLHKVQRTSYRQLVSLSFLLIVASSLLTDTLAAPSRQNRHLNSAEKKMCEPSSSAERPTSTEAKDTTLFSSVIIQCNTTIDKAKTLAKQWFKDELNRPYEQVIHHYKWSVIKQIPKNIDQSTSLQALERIDEKGALMKLYDNLILVRKAVTERERVAHKKFEKDEIIFADLTTEINQIITEVGYVLEGFQLTRPCDEASPSLIRHENSEDETARKRKNWLIFHDYIVLVEYTYDVMMYLEKKHCGSA